MKRIYWILISAILFVFLFYKQRIGINLVIFEGLILIFLLASKEYKFKSFISYFLLGSTVASLISTLMVHSIFSLWINYLSFITLIGYFGYQDIKTLPSAFGNAFINLFKTQADFLQNLFTSKGKSNKRNSFGRWLKIIALPLLIVIIFISIYSAANPIFNQYSSKLSGWIGDFFEIIFDNLNLIAVGVFILGLFFSNFIFLSKSNPEIERYVKKAKDSLVRVRKPLSKHFSLLALVNEYKAGIVLLIALNALLLFVNIIDIKWVWIGFEFEGQYLKEFVHKGTYLLILSILISIGIVLYFFRGNINFYTKNKLLKTLSTIWILQNTFLVLTVALRNYYYIQNFALAYKRIGVFIFLILTLYGLYTVYVKVRERKTMHYLLRHNTMFGFSFLLITSLRW